MFFLHPRWCRISEPSTVSLGLILFADLPSLKLTAKAPENRPSQKETILFQPSIFRCENVSFREGSPQKNLVWRQNSKRQVQAETTGRVGHWDVQKYLLWGYFLWISFNHAYMYIYIFIHIHSGFNHTNTSFSRCLGPRVYLLTFHRWLRCEVPAFIARSVVSTLPRWMGRGGWHPYVE